MSDNLQPAQFSTVGRKQIYTDDIVSRGDKGPLRVRSIEHTENGFTHISGVHPISGERGSLMLYKREKARRHHE